MDEQMITQLDDPDPDKRRQAIVALARAGDAAALKPLAYVYNHDSVPELRALALRAGKYIQQRQERAATAPKLETAEILRAVSPNTDLARRAYRSAVTHFIEGDRGEAAKEFGRALEFEPRLAEDPAALNLAINITGLSEEAALRLLRDPLARVAFARRVSASGSSADPRNTRILLGVALIIFSIVLFIFANSGLLDQYLAVLRSLIQPQGSP